MGRLCFGGNRLVGGSYGKLAIVGKGEREAHKTLYVSCPGLKVSLRVTGWQILRCTPPAFHDKEKV